MDRLLIGLDDEYQATLSTGRQYIQLQVTVKATIMCKSDSGFDRAIRVNFPLRTQEAFELIHGVKGGRIRIGVRAFRVVIVH